MRKTVVPKTPSDYDRARIIERPDGFYWQEETTGKEYGPFATLIEAVEDMEFNASVLDREGESIEEAEQEIGVSDWIDPDTGEPAEESVPRIEEH